MNNSEFEKLVIKNEDTLYRVSMSMLKNEADAQDAVHDAILIAYTKLGSLKREEYFSSWITRILINCCKKQLKMKKRIVDIGDNLPDVASRDNPYISVEIGEAINSLPEKIRIAVILYYVEDYSVKEIKRILKIPEGTVKSRLSKGRQLLKEKL
ncbi:MAG: sigma-70 family RNA polymerase sigma factor [Ruminococcus sp.]|nr:sigma-70 family RNA polymerase sigma factor [Ruminococcus sp.]